MSVSRDAVWQALSAVQDPDLKKPLTDLGMIDNLVVCDGHVNFALKLTTTACPLKDFIKDSAIAAVKALDGVVSVNAEISKDTITLQAKTPDRASVPGIRNVIAVSSGKGGVGKSTVSVNLACSLAQQGARVGILDADIYGPNVALMMGLQGQKLKSATEENKIIPPQNHGVKVISMAFLVKDNQPVVWRGPMLDKVIRQFLTDTAWTVDVDAEGNQTPGGDLDYLIIDLPPGTGDAQLTIVQATPVVGAIIVTTPQDVALLDSRKGLAMFQSGNIPILGIVENMSLYVCPSCGHEDAIFGVDGGRNAAAELNVPFLGQVPITPSIRLKADAGTPIVVAEPDSKAATVFKELAHQVVAQVCAMGIESGVAGAENSSAEEAPTCGITAATPHTHDHAGHKEHAGCC